ncbi:hypothetical protein KQX54_005546 [Cotesia glomerata]|uniref:Uncharacterized protein n=1 Tax=Cotesia glomerata TaxID=32391 RepID=A0AAV7IJ83_COTGL|nr:hypothetical protein KQX54_005546 [Cotesia glomerata]
MPIKAGPGAPDVIQCSTSPAIGPSFERCSQRGKVVVIQCPTTIASGIHELLSCTGSSSSKTFTAVV